MWHWGVKTKCTEQVYDVVQKSSSCQLCWVHVRLWGREVDFFCLADDLRGKEWKSSDSFNGDITMSLGSKGLSFKCLSSSFKCLFSFSKVLCSFFNSLFSFSILSRRSVSFLMDSSQSLLKPVSCSEAVGNMHGHYHPLGSWDCVSPDRFLCCAEYCAHTLHNQHTAHNWCHCYHGNKCNTLIPW